MKRNKWLNSLLQIAVILLAALIVTGVTWQVGQSAEQSDSPGEGREQGRIGDDEDDDDDDDDEDEDDHDHGHGRHGGGDHGHEAEWFSARGIAGFSETLVKLTVVIGAVVLGQKGWSRFQSNKQADSS